MLVKSESQRLPGKNTKLFNGKQMFLWNLEKCLKVFDEVYVSSDDYKILQDAGKEGALAIHRTKELCGDCPDIPVFLHALSKMPKEVDGIVAVHADTPLIERNLIALAKKLLETGVQEVMTCKPMQHSPVYKASHNNIGGSIRGIARERLENYGSPFEPNPDVLLVDDSIEIEDQSDFNYALQCLSTPQSL